MLGTKHSKPCSLEAFSFFVIVHSVSHVRLSATPRLYSRLPCPSLCPGVCSNSCPLSWWCCRTTLFSVTLFSCSQSFSASRSFPISWFSASAARVLELQFQHQSFQWKFRVGLFRIDWFDPFCSPRDCQESSQHNLKASVFQCSAFFMVQLSSSLGNYKSNLYSVKKKKKKERKEMCKRENKIVYGATSEYNI